MFDDEVLYPEEGSIWLPDEHGLVKGEFEVLRDHARIPGLDEDPCLDWGFEVVPHLSASAGEGDD